MMNFTIWVLNLTAAGYWGIVYQFNSGVEFPGFRIKISLYYGYYREGAEDINVNATFFTLHVETLGSCNVLIFTAAVF